jgi:hypothetical protein
MATYIVFAIILVLNYFNIFKYNFSTYLWIHGIFDIIFTLGIFLYMLRIAAEVNEYFDIHKGELLKQKKYLWEIKYTYHELQRRSKQSNESIQIYLDIVGAESDDNTRDEYIDRLVGIIDINIEKLDFDKENKPIKLLGVKASYQLLNSIYTTIISIVLAGLQYQYG